MSDQPTDDRTADEPLESDRTAPDPAATDQTTGDQPTISLDASLDASNRPGGAEIGGDQATLPPDTVDTTDTIDETPRHPAVTVPAASPPGPARSVTRRSPARVSLAAMLRHGLRGLRDHVRLFACLYLVQLAIAGGAAWLAGRLMLGAWGRSPEMEQAAAGDLAALTFLLRDQPQVIAAMAWIFVGAVALYAALSWYLAGGLNAVLLLRPINRRESARVFGAGAALTFPAYLRLAMLSLIPHAVIVIAAGLGVYLAKGRLEHAVALTDMLAVLVPALMPSLVLWWVHGTAMRYARIALSLRALSAGSQMLRVPVSTQSGSRPGGQLDSLIDNQARRLSAARCLLAGYGLVLTGWAPLLHVLLYALWFALVSAALLGITWPMAGAGAAGALLLFALRQLAALLRSAGAFVLAGGQVLVMVRSRETLNPPARQD